MSGIIEVYAYGIFFGFCLVVGSAYFSFGSCWLIRFLSRWIIKKVRHSERGG